MTDDRLTDDDLDEMEARADDAVQETPWSGVLTVDDGKMITSTQKDVPRLVAEVRRLRERLGIEDARTRENQSTQ